MSAQNGDKSRFGARRKRKLGRRVITRALKIALAAAHAPVVAPVAVVPA
ncbi:MAG TPA: hypothetical protein VKG25_23505 [Bryobacteraceae bacterium]|nr:hypothetical protein [Bryobacteraceae bacterium]